MAQRSLKLRHGPIDEQSYRIAILKNVRPLTRTMERAVAIICSGRRWSVALPDRPKMFANMVAVWAGMLIALTVSSERE